MSREMTFDLVLYRDKDDLRGQEITPRLLVVLEDGTKKVIRGPTFTIGEEVKVAHKDMITVTHNERFTRDVTIQTNFTVEGGEVTKVVLDWGDGSPVWERESGQSNYAYIYPDLHRSFVRARFTVHHTKSDTPLEYVVPIWLTTYWWSQP